MSNGGAQTTTRPQPREINIYRAPTSLVLGALHTGFHLILIATQWDSYSLQYLRGKNTVSERLSHRLKATWLVSGKTGIWTQINSSDFFFFCHFFHWKVESNLPPMESRLMLLVYLDLSQLSRCNILEFTRLDRVKSLQLCPIFCDPMDCSLPGSSVHGISQAEYWSGLPCPSFRGSFWPRNQTCIS